MAKIALAELQNTVFACAVGVPFPRESVVIVVVVKCCVNSICQTNVVGMRLFL